MIATAAGWAEMTAAFVTFFASHIVPARPPIRGWLRGALSPVGYLTLYSAISLAALGWLIVAAGRAPHLELWAFAPWQLWVPNIVMPIVCVLVALGAGAVNPFSLAGRAPEFFDPANPGIAGLTRYPVLWAVVLWALAHMAPNGNVAHVLLFGLFAVFGLIGMRMFERRKKRQWGADVWAARAANTSLVPFAAIIAGRARLWPVLAQPVRIAAGLVAWFVLFALHPKLFGVSPLPLI